jgi:hypothetical protein
MIQPAEELTLSQARSELERHMNKAELTAWTVTRIQQLTYRIHELDPLETITKKHKPQQDEEEPLQ